MWRTWAGVVLISFSAVFVRLADVEAARSAFLRNLYALPVLVALVAIARHRGGRGGARAGSTSRAPSPLMPVAVAAGLFLGVDLVFYHLSIGVVGAGLGTVLPNLQVVFVGIAGVVLFGERLRTGFWVALPVVFAGVWLLGATGRTVEFGTSVAVGILYGVLSAIFYAGYIVVLRVARLRGPRSNVFETMASATLGGVISTGTFAAMRGVAAPAGSWPADGWLLALALGSQVAGWLLLASSIHRLPAALTSVALLLQPVLAMIWGALLLAEPIGWPQAMGAAVLLAGVAGAHRSIASRETRAQPATTSGRDARRRPGPASPDPGNGTGDPVRDDRS